MQTHTEREPAAHSQTPRPSFATVQFADRRPEAATQNRLQTLAQSGPLAAQLRAMQTRADVGQPGPVQRQAMDDEEPLQGKFDVAQRVGEEDEEPLQGIFAPLQRAATDEDESPKL